MSSTQRRKSKLPLVAAPNVWKIQRAALDTALKLIKDAKKKKKDESLRRTKKRKSDDLNESSNSNKYKFAMALKCKNPKFSDMRSLNDTELLIREMRSAFCRWNWDCVVDLLVFAVQTKNQSLLTYARACFPVLVMQHPALSSQGRNLIEEAMFVAGIADPTEFTNKLFTLDEEDTDEEFNETVIRKMFSPKVMKPKSSEIVSSSSEEEEKQEEDSKKKGNDGDDDSEKGDGSEKEEDEEENKDN